MYIFLSGDHVFICNSKDEVTRFLNTLFDYSISGRILYLTMAESLKYWLMQEGTDKLLTPIPGVDMIEVLTKSMVELYDQYGKIYDPDGTCFTVKGTSQIVI